MTFRKTLGIEVGQNSIKNKRTSVKDEIRTYFNNSWNRLLEETLECSVKQERGNIQDSLDWLKEVMKANVPVGKQNRAVSEIYFFRHLVPNRTAEDDLNSYILGWCIEIMQAAALIADDMMDGSETRRGKPCWHLVENVGYSAINDTLMLENVVYLLLKRFFGHKDCYVRLFEHFHETTLRTILGQSLDTKMGLHCDLTGFNIEKYKAMIQHKTSYYSFGSPIASAMILAGLTDEELFAAVEKVMLRMGNLFQVQDDYLDCYGDPKRTGKVGTDIIDGKCTWFIVKALELGSETQKQILKEFYGSKSEETERWVKRIYDELQLPKAYFNYEVVEYKGIEGEIEKLPHSIPKEPLYSFLDLIYRRDK